MSAFPAPLARAAARTLAVDALVAEVVPALRSAGIPSVLLKGASLIGWLYREDEGRGYRDADLLVPSTQQAAAEQVLETLGFELQPPKPPAMHHQRHARPWTRARDGATVDLHRTLPGVRTDPEDAWNVLSRDLGSRTIHGVRVDILAEPARALLIALHMAHHRAEETSGMIVKPSIDLRVALERLPEEVWRGAAQVATRLHCRERLSRGLHEQPEGAAVARRLDLPSGAWIATETLATTTAAFERLGAARGWRGRVRLAARMILPRPAALRWQSRLARRSRRGLIAAYALRPFRLVLTGVPGFLEWRWRRRAAR